MAIVRKMNLNALRVAESAARLGSFTKASEEQFITPSAVSQRISRLEDELQFKIFTRKGNLIELTHQGAKLIGSIREPLDRIDLAGQTITADTTQSVMRLAIPQSMAIRWLLPKIPEFQKLHPEIFVCITSKNRFRNFSQNEFDCAIQFGNGKVAKALSTCLFQQNMTPVCSPGLIDQIGLTADTMEPSLLSSATLIHANQGTASWEVWLDHENLSPIWGSAGHAYFDTVDLALEAAVSGVGFAIVERNAVSNLIDNKKIVAPFCKDGKRKLGWHFLKPEFAIDKAPMKAFESWVLQQARLHKSDQTGA